MKIFSRWTLWTARNRVIQVIQWLVVHTSFPPFSRAYEAYYRLTVQAAVFMLRRLPEVESIYLTGSMATGQVIYGLSDIDLIVFVEDNDSRVRSRYKKFSWFFPLAGGTEISVYSRHDLPSIIEKDLHLKYKFSGNRSRLVYGRDVIAPLQDSLAGADDDAARGRISFLWRFIIRDIILNKYHFEQRHRYICRKVRRQMQECASNAPLPNGPSAIRPDPSIQEDTFLECMEVIRKHAVVSGLRGTAGDGRTFKIIEARPVINSHNRDKINQLISLITEKLSSRFSSILVSPVSLFPADEEDIGLFLVEKSPLSLQEARLLADTAGYWTTRQKLSLYITTSAVAVCLNRFDDHPRTVLWPHDSPLTFMQLSSPAAVIQGVPLACDKAALAARCNRFFKSFLAVDTSDFFSLRQYLLHPNAARLPVVDLQLLFWQILQEISLRRDGIAYLSSAALSSDWSMATGLDWIKALGDSFSKDLDGLDSKTESLYQPALNYLKELCP